jgi:hypothetical protein
VTAAARSSSSGAYRDAAQRMDAHVDECPMCTNGQPCGAGDQAAENEFRAWRAWEHDDPAASAAHRRAGFPW